jgi:peptide/nickel transport system permease protein
MANYALRRLLQSVPILFILSILLFGMVRAAPGGPLATAYRNPNVTKEQIELLKKQLGLDLPLPVQYARWMGDLLHGNLGESIKFRRPVAEMITERIPNTLVLVGVSFAVTLIIALPVGILSARKPYSWFDYIATTLTFIGQSVPVYWLGLALILVFYVTIKNPATGGPLFPAGGMRTIGEERSLADLAWHLVLPVVALSASWAAWYSRFLRSSLLDILHEDYIRTARAKGASDRITTSTPCVMQFYR